MQFRVFVSYSRQDLHLVQPIVGLLRATRDWVFHDVDSIQPGKRWEAEIEQALRSIHLVVVFWCRHARDSDMIRREYDLAIREGKDVLPLLIDDTPLPEDLLQYQWLDFTRVAGNAHASAGPEPTPSVAAREARAAAPPARSSRPVLYLALSVVAIALLALLWMPRYSALPPTPTVALENERAGPDTARRPPDMPAQAPAPVEDGAAAAAGLVIALVVLGLALAGGILLFRRRVRSRAASPEQRAMAEDLKTALTRKEREILSAE